MQQPDIKQILVKFGHFIAIGISVVIILFAFLLNKTTGLAERNVQDAIKAKNSLETTLSNSKPDMQALPDFIGNLKTNWEQNPILEKSPNHDSMYEKDKFKFIKPVPPAQQYINLPDGLTAEADMEKISVKWNAPPDLTDQKMCEIVGYLLLKRWEDRGKKGEKIFEFTGSSNTSFEDGQVESKVNYYYKVCAYTENKEAKGGEKWDYRSQELLLSDDAKNKLNNLTPAQWIKELVYSKWTDEAKVVIAPNFRLELIGIGAKTAILKLIKWEKGGWHTAICHIEKGNKIKFAGYLPKLGKVDWDPGWALINVNPRAEITRLRREKKMMVGDDNRPVRDTQGNIIYKYYDVPFKDYTAEIEYEDEKGNKIKLRREDDTKGKTHEAAPDKKNK